MYNLLKNLLKDKVNEYQEIEVSKIVFDQELIKSCEMNHCGKYNKSWTCPPAINQNQLINELKKYQKVFVFTKIKNLEDAFDVEGMTEGRKDVEKITSELRRELKGYDYKMLGAGSCSICTECTYPKSNCRFPQLAIPSLESLGINVIELAKACKVKYYNGKDTVTYFAAIFYN